MEKISGILPQSSRVTLVDVQATPKASRLEAIQLNSGPEDASFENTMEAAPNQASEFVPRGSYIDCNA